MQHRGQTSIEYLLLVAGVMLIVLIAGYGALSSASTEYQAVNAIRGAGVAPPEVTLYEPELPSVHTPPIEEEVPPVHKYPPRVICSLSFFPGPDPEIGGRATFSFTAESTGVDLDRAEVNVYWNGNFKDSKTYHLSGSRGSGSYTLKIESCGEYRFLAAVYNKDGDLTTCAQKFLVPCGGRRDDGEYGIPSPDYVFEFGSCTEITELLRSNKVKSAVRKGEVVFLVQKADIHAEPNPDGTPREACIHAEDYDYEGRVYILGGGYGQVKGNYTLYIPATKGRYVEHVEIPGIPPGGHYVGKKKYSAYRAVYLKNVKGLHFVNMRFDCATEWKMVDSREPCVDLGNSSAAFMDVNVTDFGTLIEIGGKTYTNAIPVRLKDSILSIGKDVWVIDVDDTSVSSDWKSYNKDLSNVFFVLDGASDLDMSPNATVYLKAYPDS